MSQEICTSSHFWQLYFKINNLTPIVGNYNISGSIKAFKYEKFNQIHQSLLTIHQTFIALIPRKYVELHLSLLEQAQIKFKSVDYYIAYGKLIEYG